MNGWQGTILRIDLTRGEVKEESLPRELVLKYLGGGGLNARLLFDEVGPTTDPMGPDNVLIFGVGPLVGTLAPYCCRTTVTSKSPLSGAFGDTSFSGHFGAALKFAGYDCIIIKGKAKDPVYVWIDNDRVEIRGAGHLWGKTAWEADDTLKEELGDENIKTAIVGPASESGIKFGAIIVDRFRAGGRGGGMGTVMASKNLKAIAVRGLKSVKIAKAEELVRAVDEAIASWKAHPGSKYFEENGTLRRVELYGSLGLLPIRAGQTSVISQQRIDELGPVALHKNYLIRKRSCFGCFVACTHFHSITEGPYAGAFGEKPELVAAISLAAYLDMAGLDFGIYMHDLCNEYGIDAIETGAVLGMAFYWYQKGLIDKEDTDGLDLVWGNESAAVELFHKMLKREGLGALLSLGVKGAVEEMGSEYEPPQGHIKGVGCVLPDVRIAKGWGLGAAISPRGADHLKALVTLERQSPELGMQLVGSKRGVDPLTEEDKHLVVRWCSEYKTVLDSLGMCSFPAMSVFLGIHYDTVARLFSAVTGVEMSFDQLKQCGERSWNVMRCFNVREGLGRKDDTLPRGIKDVPKPDGSIGIGSTINLEKMLDDYYNLVGWDIKTGIPTRQKLDELGLSDIADSLGLEKQVEKRVKLEGQQKKR
jgi:aldehyde:ferredoxin oxidoreductase